MRKSQILHQDLLLKQIRQKIGDKSLNDEIANILNISYDAAHRRTSQKAKFSFEEAMELAKYYQISLDQFLGTGNQLVVKRTQPVKTTEDLLNYFESSLQILDVFQDTTHSQVYYSAKDIPFFYTISNSVLSRFKFYVWMNLLNQDKFLSPFS
ncbi:helix-turn-helix domain-containing protein [Chryseobacterium sp. CT-SW4]|uniref:helix-turn-helix domain-containing protein n=1 Tax=Chryseobacterium sp. SW-1 TaxID=3157343 RepID=UPI003B024100